MTSGDDQCSIAVVDVDTDDGSAKASSDVPAVCSRHERSTISVAGVKILDAIRLSQVSVRLRNWVTRANELPVDTIGAYWAGYPETEGQFREIRNLGRKSVHELTDLLKKWQDAAHVVSNPIKFARCLGIEGLVGPDQLQTIGVLFYPTTESMIADLPTERQSAISKESLRNERSSISVAGVKILDAVRLSQVSVRLRNGVNQAHKLNMLPVDTIGAYWAGYPETEGQFLKHRNLGRKSVRELTNLLKKWQDAACDATGPINFARRIGLSDLRVLNQPEKIGILGHFLAETDTVVVSTECQSVVLKQSTRNRLCQYLKVIPFPECVLVQPLSIKMQETLAECKQHGQICPSLGVFLDARVHWLSQLRSHTGGRIVEEELLQVIYQMLFRFFKIQGMEDDKASELSSALCQSDDAEPRIEIPQNLWDTLVSERYRIQHYFEKPIQDIFANPEKGLWSFLCNILTPRDERILRMRIGLGDETPRTLEEIGQLFGVSRERIRQIEQKIIDQCSAPSVRIGFEIFLDTQREAICQAVVGNGLFVSLEGASEGQRALTGLQRFSIDMVHDTFEGWLDAHYDAFDQGTRRAGWIARGLAPAERERIERWIIETPPSPGRLRQRIRTVLREARWPITIAHILERLPDVSAQRIMGCLHEEFDVQLTDGMITTIKKLPISMRMILVLREAGRALHLSEMRAQHSRMFGFDITEHVASAALQRLEEVLIVDRGTYDLYENLSFNYTAGQMIRDEAVAQLRRNGHFTSAKVLRRQLLDRFSLEVSRCLTPYMLLGLCHDDPRFITQRGLMIGLANEGFAETFSSLTETIHEIVQVHGPISMADIRDCLAHEREVLVVTIRIILINSHEIVALARGLYDMIDRVIGDETRIERLSYAIQIALIEQGVSLPILVSRLAAVGFSYNAATILSFLRNGSFVSYSNGVFHISSPSPLVQEYNTTFHKIYNPLENQECNRNRLKQELGSTEIISLIELDFRFVMEPSTWNTERSSDDEDRDLLDQLLSEFEF